MYRWYTNQTARRNESVSKVWVKGYGSQGPRALLHSQFDIKHIKGQAGGVWWCSYSSSPHTNTCTHTEANTLSCSLKNKHCYSPMWRFVSWACWRYSTASIITKPKWLQLKQSWQTDEPRSHLMINSYLNREICQGACAVLRWVEFIYSQVCDS